MTTEELKEKFGDAYVSHEIKGNDIELVLSGKYGMATYRGNLSDLPYLSGYYFVGSQVIFAIDSRKL